jgi:hypothetical protein
MQVKGYNVRMTVTMKRIIAIALVVVLLVAIVLVVRACTGAGAAPIKIKSGQSTKLGGLNWSVISVLKTRDVGPPDNKLTAKNWFLVVDLYLINSGTDKVTLKPEAFTLSDAAGKTYEVDKKATDAQIKGLSNVKLESVFSTVIPPKQKQRVVMLFAIPDTAKKLMLNVSGAAIGANQGIQIDLGF